MYQLNRDELRELLNKNWMTHDAMWFVQCLQECGIKKTNKINRRAVKSMAAVEAKRIKKALGICEFNTFDDVKRLLEGGFEIIKGKFMHFRISFPSQNVFRWEIPHCFAYEGIKAMGVIDSYECGIVERPNGWFESLGVKYKVTPDNHRCQMHATGECIREYTFDLNS
jgi:Family of unknown function (DUF6125)